MKTPFLSALAILTLSLSAMAERGVWTVFVPISLGGIDHYISPLGDDDEMNAIVVPRLTYMTSGIIDEILAAIGRPYQLAGTEGRDKLDIERNLVLLLKGKVTRSSDSKDHEEIHFDLTETTDELLASQGVTMEQFSKLLVFCATKSLQTNFQLSKKCSVVWQLPAGHTALKAKLPGWIGPVSAPAKDKSKEKQPADDKLPEADQPPH
jgi:hypothetical protein